MVRKSVINGSDRLGLIARETALVFTPSEISIEKLQSLQMSIADIKEPATAYVAPLSFTKGSRFHAPPRNLKKKKKSRRRQQKQSRRNK